MRGRRVALLLTGVLPLLAEDDVLTTDNNVTAIVEEEDEHDHNQHARPPFRIQSLHHEKSRLPPFTTTSNPGNIVMVMDTIFDTTDIMNDILQPSSAIKPNHTKDYNVHTTPRANLSREDETTALPETDDESENLVMKTPLQKDNDSETTSPDATTAEDSDSPAHTTETDAAASDKESSVETNATTESTPIESQDAVSENGTQESGDSDESTSISEEEEDVSIDRVLVDYASKSAGALVLEKSPAMKGSSNLLNGDNDKYAIVPCADKKFVVVGLSEDILVKQVKLANYERYSSHLKDFQIMGSQTMGDWVDLGTYTAMPGNGEQAFDLKEPSWARYLKFRFLSHYGAEHYCTFSQIKVHGSTMLQGFHEQWEDSQEDLEEQDEDGVALTSDASAVTQESTDTTDAREEVTKDGDTRSIDDANKLADEETATNSASETSEQVPSTEIEADASEISAESAQEKSTDAKKDVPVDGISSSESLDEASVEERKASDASITEKELSRANAETEVVSAEEMSVDETRTAAEPDTDQSSTDLGVDPSPHGDTKSALSSASIGVTSHKAVDSGRSGSTKELGTLAITKSGEKHFAAVVASAVKAVVAEASDAILTVKEAPTVSDAVKELQQKLKTTIAIGSIRQGDETETPKEVGPPDSPIETPDSIADSGDNAKNASAEIAVEGDGKSSTTKDAPARDLEETLDGKASEGDGAKVKSSGDSAKVKSSEDSAIPKEHVVDTPTKGLKEEDGRPKTQIVEHAESTGKDAPAQLDSSFASGIFERFPSAACMDGLNYQEFKAKIIAARKGGANGGGSHQSGTVGSSGKMEPIFKTLTDEIKALQVNQSVQDQYIKALVTCYQRVMLEMAQELNDLETRHEKRLSDLEEAMDAVRSSGWIRVIAPVVTGILSFCVLGASVLFQALAGLLSEKRLQKITAVGLANSNAGILLLGACALSVLTIVLYFSADKRKRTIQTPLNKKVENDGAAGKKAVTKEIVKTPRNATSGSILASTTNDNIDGAAEEVHQTRNGTKVHPLPLAEDSDSLESPSLVTTEPDLVPAE